MGGLDFAGAVAGEYSIVSGMMLVACIAICIWCIMLRNGKRAKSDDLGRMIAGYYADSMKDEYKNDPARQVSNKYGVSEMQGKRPYMEDRYDVCIDGSGEFSFYGVFDGHGGQHCSQFVQENLCKNITSQSQFAAGKWVAALTQGFLLTDKQYLSRANQLGYDDGSTAVLLMMNKAQIFVGNVGDSRAVLVKADGKAIPLSFDHKPNRPDEKKRITDLGGQVIFWGVWRVEGILAVSRAIGDRQLKARAPLVTAAPEVTQYSRVPSDRFIVIASDGVWDNVSNDDAAKMALAAPDVQTASTTIMREAYRRGSADNICCMVIDVKDQR